MLSIKISTLSGAIRFTNNDPIIFTHTLAAETLNMPKETLTISVVFNADFATTLGNLISFITVSIYNLIKGVVPELKTNNLKFNRVKNVGIFTEPQTKKAVFNRNEFKREIKVYNTVPYGYSSIANEKELK